MECCEPIKEVREQLNDVQKELVDELDVNYVTANWWRKNQVLLSKLPINSFLDYCENKFVNTLEFDD